MIQSHRRRCMTENLGNGDNFSQRIWELLSGDEYDEARALLLDELRRFPDDHWVLTTIAVTYYEQRDYERALEYNLEAIELAPTCPAVLWDYANTLDMLEREEEALRIYRSLLRKGIRRIAHGQCGEGMRWAKGLVTNVHYRMATSYAAIGRRDLAMKHIRTHIARRRQRSPSIYTLQEARRVLDQIERMPRKSSPGGTKTKVD